MCRRDDLISMFYMLYELRRGSLPWKDLDHHDEMIEVKTKYSNRVLATEMHRQIERFVDHVERLK